MGSCASPPPCVVPRFPQVLFHVQRKLQHPISALCLEKTSSFRSSTSLMASSCSSFSLPLKCSISGRTGFSFYISSSVGRSGKFEQLDSPSSVSDLSDLIRPEESFIFCNRPQDTNFVPVIGDNQQLHFVFEFSIVSYRVLTGESFPSFLPLCIVIGISRVFNKTLTQRPLFVIENDLPKTAALWTIRIWNYTHLLVVT